MYRRTILLADIKAQGTLRRMLKLKNIYGSGIIEFVDANEIKIIYLYGFRNLEEEPTTL